MDTKPQSPRLWYETVGDWCDRWTKTNAVRVSWGGETGQCGEEQFGEFEDGGFAAGRDE